MQFDSNRAWNEAIVAVRANREVLLAVAGVFFLLPALLSAVFLTDVQTRMMENLANEAALTALISEHSGAIFGIGIGSLVLQGIGYLAVTTLLAGRGRPTVGEALGGALRALPTLVAASVIYAFALFLVLTILGGLLGAGGAAAGSAAAGGALALIVLMVLTVYTAIKFVLIVPVIVKDRLANPVAALLRSWKLTRGNSIRLFGFLALFSLAYTVLSFVATIALVAPVSLLAGQGKVLTFVAGMVSGVMGALANVMLAATLSRAHGQLAGETAKETARPFE